MTTERERLRSLLERAHTIIGIREAAHKTHKGAAWLEQAQRELNGEPMTSDSQLPSKTKTPDEWSLEDARRYAAEARERGHNPEDQCNSGWLVPLDVEIERLTRELETERGRLAGCGVAALGYFSGCAPEYDSASLQDVLRLRSDRDRLRTLVQRAHAIITIREAAYATHKGKAWLEQASRELNGELSSDETGEKPGVFDWLECPVTKEPCNCRGFCKRMAESSAKASGNCPHNRPLGTPCPRCDL